MAQADVCTATVPANTLSDAIECAWKPEIVTSPGPTCLQALRKQGRLLGGGVVLRGGPEDGVCWLAGGDD